MVEENTLFAVRNLSNHYDGEPLLQNVSFTLEEGEILCLLGPSGSGKTTLLRVLAGLEPLESGSIIFKGRDLRDVPPHLRKIGMMFQEYALFPHKTVRQNIAFGLEMQKMPAREQEKKIAVMLELVGLTGFGDRTIDQLSGGERQRVALARSLAPEPQLLLLDEPLGSLDRTLRDRLTGEIRTILKKLGVTAIFVTHDQAEAFSVADKVAVLHDGILHQFDSPERLYRFPASNVVARFLGFENLVKGVLDDGGRFHGPFGYLDTVIPPDENHIQSRPVTLLLRPEGARLADTAAPSEALPQISGVVIASRFLGGAYRLTVDANGELLTFYLPIDPVPPMPEEPVRLCLNPASLVLLTDES
ncbi:ABC transporter ATP-binding protein [Desulfopila aestuarii]|nr:ABC transporter ATP-binding protein [Desulfopila aestuarii]